MPARPSIVEWSAHAELRAARLGRTQTSVEDLLLSGFRSRRRNAGAGPWRLNARNLVVVFDHPVDGDDTRIRIVTLWNPR